MRNYQTTADVEARAAQGGHTRPPRTSGWIIAGCILGGLIVVAGMILALAA